MKRIPKGRRGGNGNRTQRPAPQNPKAARNKHSYRLIKGQVKRSVGSLGKHMIGMR